jgi:hypothetical protein
MNVTTGRSVRDVALAIPAIGHRRLKWALLVTGALDVWLPGVKRFV